MKMEIEDKKIERRQNILIVLGLMVLIGLMGGLTYAFFNYTKTGDTNLLTLGNIEFSSNYTSISLGNAFPVPKSSIQNSGTGMSDLAVSITGKTTYAGGIDYRIKAVEVSVEAGEKNIPISLHVSQDGLNTNGNEIMLFSFEDGAQVTEDAEFAAGHIVQGTTTVEGSVMLKAYVDAASVVISDTYGENGETVASFGEGKTVLTTEEWNALQGESGGVSFKIKVEAEEGNDKAGAIGYISYNKNGLQGVTPQRQSIMSGQTTTITGTLNVPGFVGWAESANALEPEYKVGQSVNFSQSKTLYAVIVPTLTSCPNCQYTYPSSTIYTNWNTSSQETTTLTTGLYKNYNSLLDAEKNYFLGVVLNSSNEVTRAYACGVKSENPNQGEVFCVEGTINGSTYAANENVLNPIYGVYDSGTNLGCEDNTTSLVCHGAINASIDDDGEAEVSVDTNNKCSVSHDGSAICVTE